jgi:hypothetical protein
MKNSTKLLQTLGNFLNTLLRKVLILYFVKHCKHCVPFQYIVLQIILPTCTVLYNGIFIILKCVIVLLVIYLELVSYRIFFIKSSGTLRFATVCHFLINVDKKINSEFLLHIPVSSFTLSDESKIIAAVLYLTI